MCLFCMAAIVSCQQEEEMMSTVPETVTLTLNIGTQSTGVSTRANDPNVQPYEGIRTLRALVILMLPHLPYCPPLCNWRIFL